MTPAASTAPATRAAAQALGAMLALSVTTTHVIDRRPGAAGLVRGHRRRVSQAVRVIGDPDTLRLLGVQPSTSG